MAQVMVSCLVRHRLTAAGRHRTTMSLSSPYAFKLGTNHCPSDEEVVEIKALLQDPTRQLQRVDNEIAVIWKIIDKLTRERDRLSAYVEAHKALISPVRRLPLDIIQEIFVACVPTHRNCVMSAREAPVLLGRICSSWRSISLSTPRLWARLHVVEPTRPYGATSTSAVFEEKLTQRLETTRTWLGRSGQCPLSLSLESSHDHHGSPPGTSSPAAHQTGRFLQTLIPFAPRWQHISFTIPPLVLDTLSLLTEADVPVLKSVALYQRPDHEPLNHGWGHFGMLRGPRITSFSVSGSNFSTSELLIRWNQLTVLSIAGPPWTIASSMTSQMVLDAISRCPELRKCKLMVNDGPSAGVQATHPIIEYPYLHTFELHCVGSVSSTFRLLLDRLSLPKLRKLTLHGHTEALHGDPEPQEPHPLNHFFAVSTRLESLRIDTDTFSKSSLLDFFRRLPPTVRELRIHDTSRGWPVIVTPSLDDDILAVLTPSPGPEAHFPALQTLFLDHCHLISDAALLRFVTARMAVEPHPTLKRVEVHFDREETLDIMPNVRPFVQAGLDVAITHLPPMTSQFSPWQGLNDAPLVPMSWMGPQW
ncbi:hypothetical protein B0H17DRAFT_1049373 [Mycena rosella]|uniref:F-box domain-containing protein n=1 Tax=Mycena rosella TaxID=1033263 RepID=A0AAD7DTX1_MYCRO|nr:hypothetical protein B0H17DRAFT_1049373 [Mycena rosella]